MIFSLAEPVASPIALSLIGSILFSFLSSWFDMGPRKRLAVRRPSQRTERRTKARHDTGESSSLVAPGSPAERMAGKAVASGR